MEVRASLHANLAAVHALQGNLAQAERCARLALGICPGNAAVLRMAVYVLVRQGNIAEALQVVFTFVPSIFLLAREIYVVSAKSGKIILYLVSEGGRGGL